MILHITNDYTGSSVYKNLVRELDNLGIKQIVYTPVKKVSSIGLNKIELKTPGSRIIYSNILNKTVDRAFYRLKIKKVLKDIKTKVDLSKIDFVHAHTWYSDGGVAYLLYKKYGLPYIVTIRNSDLNLFYKYLIHERNLGKRIIVNAQKTILISASYRDRVLRLPTLQPIKLQLEGNLKVIPNGVDPYWITNARLRVNRELEGVINILFIGKFNKGKNILLLQDAVILLNQKNNFKIKLHLVGGGGNDKEEVEKRLKQYPEWFQFYGEVHNKSKLLQIIRYCDIFAMPSFHETFGLVYVEAMLQGLPILYTIGEGIDGLYFEKIGEKINEFSVNEIVQKLNLLITNYQEYNIPIKKIRINHDWALISKKYHTIYNTSLN